MFSSTHGSLSAQSAGSAKPTCEACHARDDLEPLVFADGEERSVRVDPEELRASVHGGELSCGNCHSVAKDHPEATEGSVANAREYLVSRSGACQRCHFANASMVADSVHREASEQAPMEAPVCVDCHGAHDVKPAAEPRAAISESCGQCHEDAVRDYAGSVHGRALARGSRDVPVCTDCHGAHGVEPTQNAAFHAGSYLICAKCHADEGKMKRANLNPAVLTTFLDDFHGSSNHLYVQTGYVPANPVATCGDCHGVHDVRPVDRDTDAAAMQTRLSEACAKCHEGAPADFAKAWIGHTALSANANPLAWGIAWGYRILIPFVLLGLILHILLHFLQVASHTTRRHSDAPPHDRSKSDG